MNKLTTICAALALLGAVSGCGQSACRAHPGGLACEQEKERHNASESENRKHEEESTPEAKEETKKQEEKEGHEPAGAFFCEKFPGACMSAPEVAEKITQQVEPSGKLGGDEKFSCPEGKYAVEAHLVCTLTGSSGSQGFEVALGSGGAIKVSAKEEAPTETAPG